MSRPAYLALLLVFGSGLAFAESYALSTSVGAPNGQTYLPSVLSGTDNQIYSLEFKDQYDVIRAAAKAQSDYGILRNYVYSAAGMDSAWWRDSYAGTYFKDLLTVYTPVAGFFKVVVNTAGSIVYDDLINNSQTFVSQWGISNYAFGGWSTFTDQGTYANVPGLPLTHVMQVPLNAGVNTIYIEGQLQTYNLGRASAVTMDLFNTSQVTGLGVTDGTNVISGWSVTAASGAHYAQLSPTPEPGTIGTMLLCGLALVGTRRYRKASSKRQSISGSSI